MSFHSYQLVFTCSEADLLTMGQGFFPADIGVAVQEMVVMVMPLRIRQVIAQLAVPDRIRLQAQICARLIQRHRIEGRQHADIRQDRRIVLTVAVTVRGYIHDQADMEAGASAADRVGVFRDPAAEDLVGGVVDIGNGMEGACPDAPSASLTDIGINICLVVLTVRDSSTAAFADAAAAASAQIPIHLRRPIVVLMHLARAASSTHTDILERSAKTGTFMPFEMSQ